MAIILTHEYCYHQASNILTNSSIASSQKILWYLSRFSTACIPSYYNHILISYCCYNLLSTIKYRNLYLIMYITCYM